ncbi:hypothetical protein KP77_08040 [Jeotgalibacillus alimentarius]|uniref:Uncharacterized protein n=1 Tax=Jeotgalibacillus alimentarius TaxID=135826 RepID=A0A0C2VQU0_9BACL|nr:hypothetical protein KP77_08040 [Jeotgalibacillus alimentarius]
MVQKISAGDHKMTRDVQKILAVVPEIASLYPSESTSPSQ